jgi:hypothetical protein
VSIEIRAMSLAEILDTGFQLVKSRFALLAGVSMLGQVPSIVFLSVFSWVMDPFSAGPPNTDDIGVTFVVLLVLYLLTMMLLFPFVLSAVVKSVGDLYLGRELKFADVLRSGLSRMLPLFVTYVIFGLVSMVIMTIFVVVVAAAVALTSGVTKALGALGGLVVVLGVIAAFVAFLAVGLLYFVVSLIVAVVVVLEEISLFEALARTWTLVASEPMRAVGVAVTVYLIVAVPAFGVQLMVGVIPVLGTVLWGAVQAVGYAYMFATSVVLYFDIRCRRESFDLEVLARMVEGQEPSAVGPAF